MYIHYTHFMQILCSAKARNEQTKKYINDYNVTVEWKTKDMCDLLKKKVAATAPVI